LRKKVKGWSRNMEAERNKRKREVVREMEDLDKLSELHPLTPQ
jgi:hypothetical protein